MGRLRPIFLVGLLFTLTSALNSSNDTAPSHALPGPISICLDSSCENCTTTIDPTPDQIGEHPECVVQSASIFEGPSQQSSSNGHDIAYISVPEPREGCVFLVHRPTSLDSRVCGAVSVYARHAGCYFTDLSGNFSLQTCCDAQRCGDPFSQHDQQLEQWDAIYGKVPAVEGQPLLEVASSGDAPQPTPMPAMELRFNRRSWHWPWDKPAHSTPPSSPSTSAPAPTPTTGATPSSTLPQLDCSGSAKLVSPAIETEGAQIRIGSDINCAGSNSACAQAQSIAVDRQLLLFAFTLPQVAFKVGVGASIAVNIQVILGFIPVTAVITQISSSLTIPPGSRGVLTWTPFYRCGVLYAQGCNQGVNASNIRACQPILDQANRAVGEYRVVTVG